MEAVPRHTRKESCRAQVLCSPRSPLYSQRHLWWKTRGVLLQPLSPPPAESWSSAVPPYLADTLEEFWLGQGHHLSDTVYHAVFRDPLSYTPRRFRLALHGTTGLSSTSLLGHNLAGGWMSLKPAPARPSSLITPANPRPNGQDSRTWNTMDSCLAQKQDSPCLSIAPQHRTATPKPKEPGSRRWP